MRRRVARDTPPSPYPPRYAPKQSAMTRIHIAQRATHSHGVQHAVATTTLGNNARSPHIDTADQNTKATGATTPTTAAAVGTTAAADTAAAAAASCYITSAVPMALTAPTNHLPHTKNTTTKNSEGGGGVNATVWLARLCASRGCVRGAQIRRFVDTWYDTAQRVPTGGGKKIVVEIRKPDSS